MQSINIERSLATIETRLRGRKCLDEILALAKEYPEQINRYLSLAELIEMDLNSRGIIVLKPCDLIDTTIRVTETKETCKTIA